MGMVVMMVSNNLKQKPAADSIFASNKIITKKNRSIFAPFLTKNHKN
tara:strand:- start:405 stop:545 length:141 start_codon:yes stop_codon:yes gene_type:complete